MSKVKLSLYKSFCKEIEFNNYLQGVGDPGTRLMVKFRSGMVKYLVALALVL